MQDNLEVFAVRPPQKTRGLGIGLELLDPSKVNAIGVLRSECVSSTESIIARNTSLHQSSASTYLVGCHARWWYRSLLGTQVCTRLAHPRTWLTRSKLVVLVILEVDPKSIVLRRGEYAIPVGLSRRIILSLPVGEGKILSSSSLSTTTYCTLTWKHWWRTSNIIRN